MHWCTACIPSHASQYIAVFLIWIYYILYRHNIHGKALLLIIKYVCVVAANFFPWRKNQNKNQTLNSELLPLPKPKGRDCRAEATQCTKLNGVKNLSKKGTYFILEVDKWHSNKKVQTRIKNHIKQVPLQKCRFFIRVLCV